MKNKPKLLLKLHVTNLPSSKTHLVHINPIRSSLNPRSCSQKQKTRKSITKNTTHKQPDTTFPISHYFTPWLNSLTIPCSNTLSPKNKTNERSSSSFNPPSAPSSQVLNLSSGNKPPSSQRIIHIMVEDNLDPFDQWLPQHLLPFNRSSHPFDQSCSTSDLACLTRIVSLPPTFTVAQLHSSPSENLNIRLEKSFVS